MVFLVSTSTIIVLWSLSSLMDVVIGGYGECVTVDSPPPPLLRTGTGLCICSGAVKFGFGALCCIYLLRNTIHFVYE